MLGYRYECLFLNSGFFGCPQSRDRIYIVFWRDGNPRPDLRHRPAAWCTSDRCGGKEVIAAQAWKPRKASWPLPYWGKYGAQYFYVCTECNREVVPHRQPAAAAIDWSDLGPTVGERDRPLKPKTLDRIRRGITKFRDAPLAVVHQGQLLGLVDQQQLASHIACSSTTPDVTASPDLAAAIHSILMPVAGTTYERPGQTRARSVTTDPSFALTGTLEHAIASMPFLIEMRGGGSVQAGQHDITGPMHTVTAGGMHHGLVVAGFTKINGGPTDTRWHDVTDPLGTITGRDTTGLISATIPLTHANAGDRARHIGEQLGTLTTARERYLINANPADLDLDSVHFRMLRPDPELRKAMGFRNDYTLFGTQTQLTQGLGNAVTPPVATWITERVLGALHRDDYRISA